MAKNAKVSLDRICSCVFQRWVKRVHFILPKIIFLIFMIIRFSLGTKMLNKTADVHITFYRILEVFNFEISCLQYSDSEEV